MHARAGAPVHARTHDVHTRPRERTEKTRRTRHTTHRPPAQCRSASRSRRGCSRPDRGLAAERSRASVRRCGGVGVGSPRRLPPAASSEPLPGATSGARSRGARGARGFWPSVPAQGRQPLLPGPRPGHRGLTWRSERSACNLGEGGREAAAGGAGRPRVSRGFLC